MLAGLAAEFPELESNPDFIATGLGLLSGQKRNKLARNLTRLNANSCWSPQSPTERQQLFLSLNDTREVFYGGAAGGAKSSALLMAALEFVEVSGYSALLLRRTYADLSKPGALMDRANGWLRNTAAKWNEQKKSWTFPSGATLTFGYLDTENDKYQFQGAEFQFVGFDELSQFTESQYLYLFSRLRRLAASDIPLRMRGASNPGGIGARWVYRRFIPETFTPQDAVDAKVWWKEGVDEGGREFKRAFIPARLQDNPHLDREQYEEFLNELDPITREQLLRGDWLISERGDILSMWDEKYHVISWSEFARVVGKRHIPNHWLLGVYQDVGTTTEHPCVTSWFATAPQNAPAGLAGQVFLYRGLTVTDWTPRQIATEVYRLTSPDNELERTRRWRMSHEAASERLAYRREHSLPFESWPTGKTRGIAQLRNALELIDKDQPHPFRPHLRGHPRLYLVVDDKELLVPTTDDGLVRHRAEVPAYHWAVPKSGDAPATLVPYALFNDAVDTMRAAAADYFPLSKSLTQQEKFDQQIPEEYRLSNLLQPSTSLTGRLTMTPQAQLAHDLQRSFAQQRMKPRRTRYLADDY
jgi:hypothetical protein